jgi:hypothetical protein
VSARESIENLWDRAVPIGPLLDKLEAEVRHSAAEEIRSFRDSCGYDQDSPEYRHMTGSANWIDPEVER